MHSYYVRIGSMGEIFSVQTPSRLDRSTRILVRTTRGVEVAAVVTEEPPSRHSRVPAVRFVRRMTAEDDLLLERLERHKREAVEACREALRTSGSASVLLDVDQLFDGGTLILHFLGPVDDLGEAATRQVIERYESIVRSGEFAKLLEEGCGPGCGTSEGAGCGGGCAGCAVAEACGARS